jgi:hypothetical protein
MFFYQSLTTTSNAHQKQDKEQNICLWKSSSSMRKTTVHVQQQCNPSEEKIQIFFNNHHLQPLATYLHTYYPLTHAIHEWVSAQVGTKPIWQMTKEFHLEGVVGLIQQ